MKKTISLLLALLLCIGLTSPALAADAPFTDVPSSHWAYKEIMEAYKDGAVQGTAANAYNPNGNVTMAQFVAILTRAFCSDWVENGETLVAEGVVWYVPNDIAADAWYTPNYIAAEEYDLFWEVPNNSPDVEVTREVMAQILYNLMRFHLYGPDLGDFSEQDILTTGNKIPDFGSVSSSMREAVAACYSLGVITGIDSTGRFSPQGRMNRAQTAVIYVRLKQVMETGTGIASQTGTGTSAGTSGATLTNGKPATEENVLALMEEYENGKAPVWEKAIKAGFTSYKDLAKYDAYEPKYYSAVLRSNGIECAKFAFAFWDELFGDLPMREVASYKDIRPGDLIHWDGHWAIAMERPYYDPEYKDEGHFVVHHVGGGAGGHIGWGGNPWPVDEDNYYHVDKIYTRYPD